MIYKLIKEEDLPIPKIGRQFRLKKDLVDNRLEEKVRK
ncbi:hypothetical protein KJ693_12130 [bacterium]|nr:hypothetical protein [bacterium]